MLSRCFFVFFCQCRGICHRTESDLFFVLFFSYSVCASLASFPKIDLYILISSASLFVRRDKMFRLNPYCRHKTFKSQTE